LSEGKKWEEATEKLIDFLCQYFLPKAEIAKNVPSGTKTTINLKRKLRQVELKVKLTNEDEAGNRIFTSVHTYIHICGRDVWPITHTHTLPHIEKLNSGAILRNNKKFN